jgi:triacylglycerol lipase
MGGLDARYMISQLGMENQVLTLTTIGTPHRGSSFADWMLRKVGRLIRPILNYFRMPHQAFYDLTTETCMEFNQKVVDAPTVRYFSIVGRCERPLLGPEWWFPARIVRKVEGENDGVVSVASATYGESAELWEADHMNLVNWPNRRARRSGIWEDRAAEYGRIIGRFVEMGYGWN